MTNKFKNKLSLMLSWLVIMKIHSSKYLALTLHDTEIKGSKRIVLVLILIVAGVVTSCCSLGKVYQRPQRQFSPPAAAAAILAVNPEAIRRILAAATVLACC